VDSTTQGNDWTQVGDRDLEDTTLATSYAEDSVGATSADHTASSPRDTSESDRELLETVVRDVSGQANTADSTVTRGLELVSSTVNGDHAREQLLGLKGADARAVLQVLQNVRTSCIDLSLIKLKRSL
jgi:hypothetical protein